MTLNEVEKRRATLYLDPDDLAELSKLLSWNIKDRKDLFYAAKNVTTLSIKGMEKDAITLDSYLLNRLRSRCHPTQNFPEWIRTTVVRLLADFCGA
jgi:hypothetical protein